jgi:hypothetical protein
MKNLTTIHLNPPRARLSQVLPLPVMIAVIIFFALCAAGLVGRVQLPSSAAAAVPTPGLIIMIATAQPQPIPTAAPAAQVAYQLPATPRYVVGFDSPNGRALGAILAPEASAIVGRWGDDWLQTTHDGAPIWIRASELGMNIASQPAQEAAPAPIAPQADYQTASQQKPAGELVSAPAIEQPAPTTAPMEQTDVTQEWARQQWAAEHCIGGACR